VTFKELWRRLSWRPIPGCPGRFVLNQPGLAVEGLAGSGIRIREYRLPTAEDPVLLARFDGGGGLLSYAKPDGTFVHTLNTAEGLDRKLAQLGIEPIIAPAETAADIDEVRRLFVEYQRWLDVDLCFQSFDAELAGLPGKYAPPGGALLLCRAGAQLSAPPAPPAGLHISGGVGLRPLDDDENRETCEMKRLFVRPAWRGVGHGRLLADAIVAAARHAGYSTMRLDTLARLKEALTLYRRMGFVEIEPYYENPEEDVVFMELAL
jgi:GNAT superfamily N-acetyltransferase